MDMDVEQFASWLKQDEHPNLLAGAQTLENLIVWVNRNSDGWSYWQPPRRAAAKLIGLLTPADPRIRYTDVIPDCTLADLKAAYTPLKAFRTKADKGQWSRASGSRPGWCDFQIVDPAEAAQQRIEDAKDAVGTHVRYTIILERPLDTERSLGIVAARDLERDLRERLGDKLGEFVVAGRRLEGRARLPLHELSHEVELNGPNFQDAP